MIESSTPDRLTDERQHQSEKSFLETPRALTVCNRELTRLTDGVLEAVAALAERNGSEEAEIRQSPTRCIVQLGPVALTLAWLRRSYDAVAGGELLVIVWNGAVGPSRRFDAERSAAAPRQAAATLVWEQTLSAEADDAESWRWQAADRRIARCSSSELAVRCVDALHAAYRAAGTAAKRRSIA